MVLHKYVICCSVVCGVAHLCNALCCKYVGCMVMSVCNIVGYNVAHLLQCSVGGVWHVRVHYDNVFSGVVL